MEMWPSNWRKRPSVRGKPAASIANAIVVRAGSIRQSAAAAAETGDCGKKASAATACAARRGLKNLFFVITASDCFLSKHPGRRVYSFSRRRSTSESSLHQLRKLHRLLFGQLADHQIAATAPRPRGERKSVADFGAGRRIRRSVGDDAEQDRLSGRIDIRHFAERRALIGKVERDLVRQAGQRHRIRRETSSG